MREKGSRERSAVSPAAAAAGSCMNSSQVKQALSKLDKADGDGRRTALNSLKQCIEAMDSASVPRFIAQVSDTRESSRNHAISLYEDLARVHGRLVSPHIPRVMTVVTKTLSSSGSSPQLQQACAKVIYALAKHAIDDEKSSPAEAGDVLRDLCNPLLEVLTGKLEPLTAGAAICLQTLVESERWKFASPSVVEDLCLKTTVALAEKSTRTVAHMQLAKSLAASNSAFLGRYGVTLLRSGVEVLRSSAASASWQQRASAARLLTAILPTVDRATLAEELSITVQALEECKLDRMSNVRWAVKEALNAAKGVLTDENSRRSSDGDELLSWTMTSPEPSTSSPRRRSSLGGVSSDDMMSPPSMSRTVKSHHRGSPLSSVIPLSPSAPSRSPRSHATAAADQLPHRSPLRATRMLHSQVGGTVDTSFTSFHNFESPRKENLPSHDPDTKPGALLAFDSDLSPSCKPSTNEGTGAAYHSLDSGLSPAVASKGQEEDNPSYSPDPLNVLVGRGDLGGDFLGEAEEDDMFLLSNGGTPPLADSGHESSEPVDTKISSRDGGGLKDSPMNGSSRGYHGVLNSSTMKHIFELKGPALRSSPRTKDDEIVTAAVSPSRNNHNEGKESSYGFLGSPVRADSSSHLTSFEDPLSPQSKPLIAAEDFLPFTTPRRLVRSLQECLGSPQPASSPARSAEHDLARSRDEDDFGDRTGTDMDLGTPTSTGTGWSVRTNPIASDESLRTESDDSDHEQQRASWKKMVLEPSTSPTPPAPPTPPAQETDNPDLNDGFRHRLSHPTSAAAPSSLLQADDSSRLVESGDSAVELKPELTNEVDIKRMSLGEGDATRLDNDVDKWPCSDTRSPAGSEPEKRAASKTNVHCEDEREAASVLVLPVETDNSKVVQVLLNRMEPLSSRSRRGWRERLRRALFNWHVCAVIVAIPFAIVLYKGVFPSDPRFTGYLVPT